MVGAMTTSGLAALVALASMALAGGVVLLVLALRGRPAPPTQRAGARRGPDDLRLRTGLAAGAALAVALLTRWPVGALLAGALGWAWPGLFATKKASRQAIDRIEAIAVWAEMLRGMMVSAASIEQAIMATVPRAPAPIRAEVERLADRLAAGEPLVTALRPLADAINDDVGDLVVGALLLAADPSQKAGGLARQLAELAVRARQKAGYRQRVQTGRARIYASARAIIVITLGMVAALLVFARGFLSPYGSPVGQLALLAIGAIFGLGFALLARLGRMRIAERFLATTTTQAEAGPW
jgi:Flp pilus assembly protein TadB